MPIPSDVIRYAMSGPMPNGEEFVTSLWTQGQSVASQNDANLVASTMATTLDDHAATFTSIFAAGTQFSKVTAYCYPDGGPTAKYIGEGTPTANFAGSGHANMPLQAAIVVTLLTGLAGRSFRGRLYLPCTMQDLDTNHQMEEAVAATLASNWASILHDVDFNNAGHPVVVSTKLGTATGISSVRVDTRLDVQRRRANKQAPEHTSTQPVTYP